MKSRIPMAAMRDAAAHLAAPTPDRLMDQIRSWNGESNGLAWDAESYGLAMLESWTGHGLTPLHLAAAFSDFEPVLSSDLSVFRVYEDGLWISDRERPSLTVVRRVRTEHGWTPLHMAAMFSQKEFWLHFLEGYELRIRTERGWTPLHLAAGYNEDPRMVKGLLRVDDDEIPHWYRRMLLKARDEDGSTPLHLAAAFSETSSVVEELLLAGANPNTKDAEGKIPWDLISDESPLKGTDAYWWLYEGRFE